MSMHGSVASAASDAAAVREFIMFWATVAILWMVSIWLFRASREVEEDEADDEDAVEGNGREGFAVGDLDGLAKDVKTATSAMDKIPAQLNGIETRLNAQMAKMGDAIEQKTLGAVTSKFKSVFTQLGDIFDEGLVQPLLMLFTGFGQVFMQIFGILGEVGAKIVSLPGCLMTYAIHEVWGAFAFFYKLILPKFLRSMLDFVYAWTIGLVFTFVGWLTGYTDSLRRCYRFNVDKEIKAMSVSFDKIGAAFKKNFGRLDFSKIRV